MTKESFSPQQSPELKPEANLEVNPEVNPEVNEEDTSLDNREQYDVVMFKKSQHEEATDEEIITKELQEKAQVKDEPLEESKTERPKEAEEELKGKFSQKYEVVEYLQEPDKPLKILSRNIKESLKRIGKINLNDAYILEGKYPHVGKLVIRKKNTKSQKGVASGVLIHENIFLTARHCYFKENGEKCFDSGSMEAVVVFGAWENFHSQGEEFKVLDYMQGVNEEHKLLGEGDYILLKLEVNENRKKYGFTPLEYIETVPERLYLLQYGAGSHLKVSLNDNIEFSSGEIKVTHKIAAGMSGAPYFTENGQIFAIHIGQDGSSGKGGASLPWTEDSKYIDNLILQSKSCVEVKGIYDKINYTLWEFRKFKKRGVRVWFLFKSIDYNVKYIFEDEVHISEYTRDAEKFYANAGKIMIIQIINKVKRNLEKSEEEKEVWIQSEIIAKISGREFKLECIEFKPKKRNEDIVEKKQTAQEQIMQKQNKNKNKH